MKILPTDNILQLHSVCGGLEMQQPCGDAKSPFGNYKDIPFPTLDIVCWKKPDNAIGIFLTISKVGKSLKSL